MDENPYESPESHAPRQSKPLDRPVLTAAMATVYFFWSIILIRVVARSWDTAPWTLKNWELATAAPVWLAFSAYLAFRLIRHYRR